MKVVILAGGMGTRIAEESASKPKPLVTIGRKPIIWHIMKIYAEYGFKEFIVCCGYKGHMIKKFFLDYAMYQSDLSISLKDQSITSLNAPVDSWKITLVNTGLNTPTAGRILCIREFLDNAPFMLTYGDGVADINIADLLCFHQSHGRMATITAARPAARFGTLEMDGEYTVHSFLEKKQGDQGYVNAGFAVFNPDIFGYLGDGSQMLEKLPLETAANEGQLKAYCHRGFWAPMDTMHERIYLENLWMNHKAPWKIWE